MRIDKVGKALMKAKQVGGMMYVSGVANVQALLERYSLPNPAYVQAIRTGRRPWRIPEWIYFAEKISTDMVAIPLPCWRGLKTVGALAPELLYIRAYPLRPEQDRALFKWMVKPFGILQAPAGSGKTIIGCTLIKSINVSTAVIVPTLEIKRQWQDSLGNLVNHATVLTYHSAAKSSLLRNAELIIIDECHRTPCKTIYEILKVCPARYRYGLTATPWRADGLHKALDWLLGGVTAKMERKDANILACKVIRIKTPFNYYFDGDAVEFQTWIANDVKRNKFIADKLHSPGLGNSRLVLSHRVSQLDYLSRLNSQPCYIVTGATTKKLRTQYIGNVRCGHAQTLFATYQLASEGLDIPRLDTLVLASPTGNPKQIEQACGRIARPFPGKGTPVVYDFVDGGAYCERLAKKREAVYQKLGFEVAKG